MKTYYFVGGPLDGQQAAFFRQLEELGGAPPAWRIYPHANGDGSALHVIESESEAPILAHLARFGRIYQRGPITEVVSPSRR